MRRLTLNELRSYVWVYWCLADGATGRSTAETKRERQRRETGRRKAGRTGEEPHQIPPDELQERLRGVLTDSADVEDRLRRLRAIVEDAANRATSPDTDDTVRELLMSFGFPMTLPSDFGRRSAMEVRVDDDPPGLSGFSADNVALWFRPATEDSAARLGPALDNPRTAFAEGKTFSRKILEFPTTNRFREWRDGDLNVAKVLNASQKKFLSTLGGFTGNVSFIGTLLIGPDPEMTGVTWIGIRDHERYATLGAVSRGRLLATPADTITIDATPLKTVGWTDYASLETDLNKLTQKDLLALATDIAAEIDRSTTESTTGLAIATRGDGELHGYRLSSTGNSAGLVRVISNVPAVEAERTVIARLPRTLSRLIVSGREHLASYLARFPWLWSKHLGSAFGFRLLRRDGSDDLEQLLARDALSNLIPRGSITHPAIRSVTTVRPNLMIVGRSGSGKTTALRQVLQRATADSDFFIVIDPSFGDVDATLLRMILNECSELRNAIMVIDDLQFFGQPLQLPKAKDLHNIALVVTFWSSHRRAVSEKQSHLFAERRFVERNLDAVESNGFLVDLARVAVKQFRVTAKDDWWVTYHVADRVVEWDGLPSTLVTHIYSCRGSALRAFTPPEAGRSLWSTILNDIADKDERAIIETLSLLRKLFWIGAMERDLVIAIVTSFYGCIPAFFDKAVRALMERGWISVTGGNIYAHDTQIEPGALGLWGAEHFHMFAEWLAAARQVLGDGPWERLLRAACNHASPRDGGRLMAAFWDAFPLENMLGFPDSWLSR